MTNVLRLRKASGLSRKELSDALGVNEITIYRWESGVRKRIQDCHITIRMAEIFHCTPYDVDPTFKEPEEKSVCPLKRVRLKMGLSQEVVGNYCNISRGAVSEWERGKVQPSKESLLKLTELFSCSAEELGFSLDSAKSIARVEPPPVEERNRLVLEYLNIIPYVMRCNETLIRASKCERDDLRQALALRLCHAVDTYDRTKGDLKVHAIKALEWEVRTQAALASTHGITHAPRDCFLAVVSMDSLAEAGMQFSA